MAAAVPLSRITRFAPACLRAVVKRSHLRPRRQHHMALTRFIHCCSSTVSYRLSVFAVGLGVVLCIGCNLGRRSAATSQSVTFQRMPTNVVANRPTVDIDWGKSEMDKLLNKVETGSTLGKIEAWAGTVLSNTVPDSMSGGEMIYTLPEFLESFDTEQRPVAGVFWEKSAEFVEITWASMPQGAKWPVLSGFMIGKPDFVPPDIRPFKNRFRELKPGVFLYTSTLNGQDSSTAFQQQ